MSNQPNFCQAANVGTALLSGTSAANTSRIPPTALSANVLNIFTAAANGSRVDRITINSCGTAAANTAQIARIWVYDTTALVFYLFAEISVTSATAGNNVKGGTGLLSIIGGLYLKSGQALAISMPVVTATGDQYSVVAEGGDL